MQPNFRSSFIVATFVGLASLGACGGGDPAAPPSVPPSNGPTRADYDLVTMPQAADYPAGSGMLAFFRAVNDARLVARVGALKQDARLDVAASAHLNYLHINGYMNMHGETPGVAGYTGATPAERITAAGYDFGQNTEVVAGVSSTGDAAADGASCVAILLDTVYHLGALMDAWRDMGVAVGDIGGGTTGCVAELAYTNGRYGQLPDTGFVAVWPVDHQSGTPVTFLPSFELPNPMPDLGAAEVGTPIRVSMVTYWPSWISPSYRVRTLTLKDAGGQTVPARLIAAAGMVGEGVELTADPVPGHVKVGEVYLVPLVPLAHSTTYTVAFQGMADDTSYARTWQFTTAP